MAHTFCRSRAGGRTLMADTIRSSTTVTSSTRCAASRWRSSTSRDQLFPREAYRRAFEALREALPERQACRITVDLLALAHDRGCEAELAKTLAADLGAGRLPDITALRARFAPDPACVPLVTVTLASLASYESLLGSATVGDAA